MVFYKDFIKTERWKNFKNEIIDEIGCKCELCGDWFMVKLNLHHKDLDSSMYTNLSNKNNFRLLCEDCHGKIHELKDKKYDSALLDPILLKEMDSSFLEFNIDFGPLRYSKYRSGNKDISINRLYTGR